MLSRNCGRLFPKSFSSRNTDNGRRGDTTLSPRVSHTSNRSHLAAFTLPHFILCSPFSPSRLRSHTHSQSDHFCPSYYPLSEATSPVCQSSSTVYHFIRRLRSVGRSDKITSWCLSNDTPVTAPGQSQLLLFTAIFTQVLKHGGCCLQSLQLTSLIFSHTQILSIWDLSPLCLNQKTFMNPDKELVAERARQSLTLCQNLMSHFEIWFNCLDCWCSACTGHLLYN